MTALPLTGPRLTARRPTATRLTALGRPRSVLAVACAVFLVSPWPVSGAVASLTLAGTAAAVWTVRRPASLGPLFLLGLGVLTWVAAIPEPGLVRTLVFGTAGYAVHAIAALCAAVPAGVRLDGATWRAAVGRGTLAVGGSVLAAVLAGLPAAPAASSVLIGLALVVAAAFVTVPRLVARRASASSEGDQGAPAGTP